MAKQWQTIEDRIGYDDTFSDEYHMGSTRLGTYIDSNPMVNGLTNYGGRVVFKFQDPFIKHDLVVVREANGDMTATVRDDHYVYFVMVKKDMIQNRLFQRT